MNSKEFVYHFCFTGADSNVEILDRLITMEKRVRKIAAKEFASKGDKAAILAEIKASKKKVSRLVVNDSLKEYRKRLKLRAKYQKQLVAQHK